MLGISPISSYPISDKAIAATPNETLFYSYGSGVAPTDANAASTAFSSTDYSNALTTNTVYVDDVGGGVNNYFVFQVKHAANSDVIVVTWTGKSSISCATATIYLQIYNYTTPGWETLQSNSTTVAATPLTLTGTKLTSLSSYYAGDNVVTARVYQ